jgi:hypothetical protein
MQSRHTYINKLKRLDSLDDFRNILAKDYSSGWKNSSKANIERVFGTPKKYPCFLAVDIEEDNECVGWGADKIYHFYYI